jgi:Asp/Glu/hydantoin racemase
MADIRILILNPNSSESMSKGMEKAVRELPLSDSIKIEYYTAPSSAPASIDDMDGIVASTKAVEDDAKFKDKVASGNYDAILVACYSVHKLVSILATQVSIPVTGIFEASILTSISLLPPPSVPRKWGIVTTGAFWEAHLSAGVRSYLGQSEGEDSQRFAGVFTTGLTAGDFHHISPEDVKKRLKEATLKLIKSAEIGCIVMGCAGMAGLEEIIRSTVQDVYPPELAAQLFVVDGVKAGILQLEQTVRSRRAFK